MNRSVPVPLKPAGQAMRVLLVTHAPHRFEAWVSYLERAGAPVQTAAPESRLPGELSPETPLVALLDLVDAVCPRERFRELSDRLSGRPAGLIVVAPEQSLAALAEADVDDVVPIRAAPEELLYRLRRVAERIRQEPPSITLGELVIRPETGLVLLGGERIEMRLREFELLRYLASRPNRVFRREELAREVWGPEFAGSLRTVDTHIQRLRSRLGEFGRAHIQTVRPVGYRMSAPNAAPPRE